MTEKPSPAMMPKKQKAIDKKNKKPYIVQPHMQAKHLRDNPLLAALKHDLEKKPKRGKGKKK